MRFSHSTAGQQWKPGRLGGLGPWHGPQARGDVVPAAELGALGGALSVWKAGMAACPWYPKGYAKLLTFASQQHQFSTRSWGDAWRWFYLSQLAPSGWRPGYLPHSAQGRPNYKEFSGHNVNSASGENPAPGRLHATKARSEPRLAQGFRPAC